MKKWYSSKTVWIGIFKILGGLAGTIVSFLEGTVNYDILIPSLLAGGNGILDIIIRFQTTGSVQL